MANDLKAYLLDQADDRVHAAKLLYEGGEKDQAFFLLLEAVTLVSEAVGTLEGS